MLRSSFAAFSFALILTLTVAPLAPGQSGSGSIREIGQLVLDGIPEIPERIVERTNQYQNVRTASFRDWMPGGGMLIATRFGETSQLHHVSAPMSARRQLTFYHEPVSYGSFGKKKDWFVFLRDWGGNEAAQLFRFDLTSGQASLLTDGESQNGGPLWSNAEDRFVWRSTVRNKKDHDIWMMDPESPEGKRLVLETKGWWGPADWSPEDSKIVVAHYVSINESYFWIVDVDTGEKRPFSNHERVDGATIAYGSAQFDREGEGLFFTSDESSEFRTLRYSKLDSKEYEEITRDIGWDVSGMTMSRDRKQLAFKVNAGGTEKLYLMDTKSREYREVELPLGLIAGFDFSRDGKTLAFTFESPQSPQDVYSVDVASRELTRWTESEVGGLDTGKFRMSELVQFPTFDEDQNGERRMIPAFLYKPEGDGPFPVIVRIHGGPESQSKAWFSYTSQYEVNELGCAVIYPNVRGSSGFGKSYVKLDNGFKREDSVKDIGALLDWIAERDDLDETRVGVTGGSYGGYMVLSALTHYSDRLRAGVESVGISNFVTFLENTSDYRRDLRRAEYGDERDEAMYEHLQKISPTNNAEKINVPLFVIQGANDPRVPASEAEQIVQVVRDKGKHCWYMLAKDEGHGFRKKGNRDQSAYARSLFWETYLLADEPRLETERAEEVPGASH